ncbi:hypothetical protein P168DRAFT_329706 [Aspergillus campestris IBT 28561]|uniref:HNH nuclease domain-containing protein n=1 Tax=Aspergillus campestris (strain IBT 28561) TaxID=1392248 RepID=A0A2I1CVZ3_ASPC2|nr:uncharacterized protein P168DRAFT_329706 [Aspergillus campestris IBT 28561]PKY01790.1 hypothetical protein P168DRAFT_329706 [Aspergillus campestris IBT 28561]
MISSDKMPIPEKYASLMPEDWKLSLRDQQKRTASQVSQLSQFPAASSDGLLETRANKSVVEEEFQEELASTIAQIVPLTRSLDTLARQKRVIEEDLEDEIAPKKLRDEEPDLGFLERAYASTVTARVMGASAKQSKQFSKKDQSAFRQAVLHRYQALKLDDSTNLAYCHLTGWSDAEYVKAAHLVPKLLTGQEISFLFGVKEVPLTDPRNGISLNKNIEIALDQGKIAIIPSSDPGRKPIKWKCVLVDPDMGGHIAMAFAGTIVKWKELDHKELVFLSDNRPARRFLYFRFLITYLNAKRANNTAFTSTVESKDQFWASPGDYLERSTLKSLARNISGLELPPTLLEHTFEHEPRDESAADSTGTILSSLLREATVESTRELEEGESDGEDEEEGHVV